MSYHTRDREILCSDCHQQDVREKKERAHRSLREKRKQKPADHTRAINIAIAAAILLVVGGFVLLMTNRGDVVAKQMPQENAAQAPAMK